MEDILSASPTTPYTPTFSNPASTTSDTSFVLLSNLEIATPSPPSPAFFPSHPVPDFGLQKFNTLAIRIPHLAIAITSKTEPAGLLHVPPTEIDTNMTITPSPWSTISDMEARSAKCKSWTSALLVYQAGFMVPLVLQVYPDPHWSTLVHLFGKIRKSMDQSRLEWTTFQHFPDDKLYYQGCHSKPVLVGCTGMNE